MTHITEDELLAYALEALTCDEERGRIAVHLGSCSECRLLLEKIEREIEILGGVEPIVSSGALTRPGIPRRAQSPDLPVRQTASYAIFRAAALIAIGILVGLSVSTKIPHEPEFLSSSYVTLSPPNDSLTPYTASDGTGVPAHYYEQLLEQKK